MTMAEQPFEDAFPINVVILHCHGGDFLRASHISTGITTDLLTLAKDRLLRKEFEGSPWDVQVARVGREGV